jgi:hypothetical protein
LPPFIKQILFKIVNENKPPPEVSTDHVPLAMFPIPLLFGDVGVIDGLAAIVLIVIAWRTMGQHFLLQRGFDFRKTRAELGEVRPKPPQTMLFLPMVSQTKGKQAWDAGMALRES